MSVVNAVILKAPSTTMEVIANHLLAKVMSVVSFLSAAPQGPTDTLPKTEGGYAL